MFIYNVFRLFGRVEVIPLTSFYIQFYPENFISVSYKYYN